MPITASVALVAAAVAAAMAAIAARSPDPVEPDKTEDELVSAVERRPALVRFVRRLSRRAAGSLFVAGAFVVVAVLFGAVGAMLDMINSNSGFARWDEALAEWGAAHSTPSSARALALITHLGSSVGTILVAIVVGYVEWRRRNNRDVPLFLSITYLGHAVLSNGLKWLIERDRPPVEHLVGTVSSSFPSTHSGTAAAMWAATALVLGAGRSRLVQVGLIATAGLITVAVAASRALLGVHWLTDVLAGVSLGWAWFLLVAVAFGGRLIRFGEPAERIAAETDARGVTTAAATKGEAQA